MGRYMERKGLLFLCVHSRRNHQAARKCALLVLIHIELALRETELKRRRPLCDVLSLSISRQMTSTVYFTAAPSSPSFITAASPSLLHRSVPSKLRARGKIERET